MITVKRTNVREKNEVMSTINLFEQRHFFVRTEEIFLSKILIFPPVLFDIFQNFTQ